jgi:hypothetical protein
VTLFDFAASQPWWALCYLLVGAVALAGGCALAAPAFVRAALLYTRAAQQREARLSRRVETLHATLRALRVDMGQRITTEDSARMVDSHNAAMRDALAARADMQRLREELAPYLKRLSQQQAASIFEE